MDADTVQPNAGLTIDCLPGIGHRTGMPHAHASGGVVVCHEHTSAAKITASTQVGNPYSLQAELTACREILPLRKDPCSTFQLLSANFSNRSGKHRGITAGSIQDGIPNTKKIDRVTGFIHGWNKKQTAPVLHDLADACGGGCVAGLFVLVAPLR
ncbi:hypothetical protein CCHOA_11005 [Corynebacterium choanae]|uniref:Uncharacterized protein n=1 Tax=Corynebacterium choanae TaxID=1862358 RepID=A0A3G6J9J1_9CORY|nr:hypothetical protein CCHOA_11005 [Corynebacterium choanae]